MRRPQNLAGVSPSTHAISYRPRSPLGLVVERFWWQRRAEPSLRSEHILPTGKVQLVIALHDAPFSWSPDCRSEPAVWAGGIVHGPQSSYYLTGPKPRGATIGVAFRPGAAGAALGIPIGELTDRHVTLEELWGSRGRLLHERLAATTTPEAAFALLEAELIARLRLPLLIHPAVAQALHPGAGEISDETSGKLSPERTVAEIQSRSGYSAKHFIALFRAAVGLTPKNYLRIRRFGGVAQLLAAGRGADSLAELANAAGYADQSHMTREFRALAGVTPTAYRPAAATSAYHHVVDGPSTEIR